MANFERISTTFTRGELTPLVTARVDYEGRFDGAEKLENFLVLVQGGARKRSGTRFVAAAKVATGFARLIPFEVSVSQNYLIEATDLAFRFYTQEGQLISGTPVEVATPYTSDDLQTLKWAQSADTMYLAHTLRRPRTLKRTSATTFSLSNFDFNDGPYLDINTTATTLTLNSGMGDAAIEPGATGVTITASAVTGINDDAGFSSADIGRLIRIKKRLTLTQIPDAVWGTPTGAAVTITSALNKFPAFEPGDKIGIRNHSNTNNNG